MIGAVCATSDSNVTALGADSADDVITPQLSAVENNVTENSISDGNNLKSEDALKMGAEAKCIFSNYFLQWR